MEIGFHGYKSPTDLESIRRGISATEGGMGNSNAHWQAFYLATTPQAAAGYSISADGSTVGGVVSVECPQELHFEDVDKSDVDTTGNANDDTARAEQLRDRLVSGSTEPLMIALGRAQIALRVMVSANGGGRECEEIIVPWSLTEHLLTSPVIQFTNDRRGVAAAAEYARTGVRPELGVAEWHLAEVLGTENLSGPAVPIGPPSNDPSAPPIAEAGSQGSHDEL